MEGIKVVWHTGSSGRDKNPPYKKKLKGIKPWTNDMMTQPWEHLGAKYMCFYFKCIWYHQDIYTIVQQKQSQISITTMRKKWVLFKWRSVTKDPLLLANCDRSHNKFIRYTCMIYCNPWLQPCNDSCLCRVYNPPQFTRLRTRGVQNIRNTFHCNLLWFQIWTYCMQCKWNTLPSNNVYYQWFSLTGQ